eukprot:TRINITY_DN67717_c8_g6_i1.p1 TRINITY_DN67717_c8_g6~~TRINITY_DN67717_c8_g6_i1.p1  ORF type:complete len:422 (+),score=20.73 TRINITY_DN67717_c8_g6_i1:42-1307(+)
MNNPPGNINATSTHALFFGCSCLWILIALVLGIIACALPHWMGESDLIHPLHLLDPDEIDFMSRGALPLALDPKNDVDASVRQNPAAYPAVEVKMGIWKVCTKLVEHTRDSDGDKDEDKIDSNCYGVDKGLDASCFSGLKSSIKAVRAFVIIGIVFSFFAGVVCLAHMLGKLLKLIIVTALLCLMGWVAYFIAFFVFLGAIGEKEYCDLMSLHDTGLEYDFCFYFVLLAWIFLILAFCVLICLHVSVRKQEPALPPPAPIQPYTAPSPQPIIPAYHAPNPSPANAYPTDGRSPPPSPDEPLPYQRPTLGMEIKMLDDNKGTADNVCVVHSVKAGGPAARAGIEPEDVIEKWDHIIIDSKEQFRAALATASVGGSADLNIYRQGTGRFTRKIIFDGTRQPMGITTRVTSKKETRREDYHLSP